MLDLNHFWFFILGALLIGYAILDGFDLGAGILHPLARTDEERRLVLNSIGPFWDGNEVWVVTFGGAMLTAFPEAYSTVFSAFYLPVIALLFCLIFRAVGIEFRSKLENKIWRSFWDYSFFSGSFFSSFIFGFTIGNCIQGIPIGPDKEFAGTYADMISPFPFMIGFLSCALFALHGALFLFLRLEGELQEYIYRIIWHCFGIFLTIYLFTTIYTLSQLPSATWNFSHKPWLWFLVATNVLFIANIPRAVFLRKPLQAFISSSITVICFISLYAAAVYPNLVVSTLNPEWSLNIYNSASSQKTLSFMRWIALIGMPFVLGYTITIYWIFRGKVKINKFSY